MDEQQTYTNEPVLRRREEMIKDLEPDEQLSETVKGGLKLDGIDGESKNDSFKNKIEIG